MLENIRPIVVKNDGHFSLSLLVFASNGDTVFDRELSLVGFTDTIVQTSC